MDVRLDINSTDPRSWFSLVLLKRSLLVFQENRYQFILQRSSTFCKSNTSSNEEFFFFLFYFGFEIWVFVYSCLLSPSNTGNQTNNFLMNESSLPFFLFFFLARICWDPFSCYLSVGI